MSPSPWFKGDGAAFSEQVLITPKGSDVDLLTVVMRQFVALGQLGGAGGVLVSAELCRRALVRARNGSSVLWATQVDAHGFRQPACHIS